jgi:hypothetical protein
LPIVGVMALSLSMNKLIPWLALAVAATGCEQSQSRLDKVTGKDKLAERATPPSAAPSPSKADRSGTLEERLARLEDAYDRNAEALDFLNKVYAQQKAQQQAQERSEPAPDAVFAVDIDPNIKAGQVEGPAQALVTIVEAWDFA